MLAKAEIFVDSFTNLDCILSEWVQVTRSVDTEGGQLSPQEKKTVEAIVKARYYMVLVSPNDIFFDRQLPNILITLQ